MKVVTIIFPDKSGARKGTVRLRWVQSKSLQQYLHEPVLKAEGLIARSMRCYIYRSDASKVRLQYVPKAGETLTFLYAPRTSV